VVALFGKQVDLGPIRVEQACRVGHGAIQHGLRLVQRGDLRRDLGQRALGIDTVA
jgi:hypothetical protein